jgi:hypothetical protein
MKNSTKSAFSQKIRFTLIMVLMLSYCSVFSISEKTSGSTEGVQVFKLVSEPNNEQQVTDLLKADALVMGRNDYIAFNLEEVKTNFNIKKVNPNQLVFVLKGIEFPEIKAFFTGADTSLVFFHFDVDKLTSENRIALYQLAGHKKSSLFPGVKINEAFTYVFNQSVTFEPSNIHDKASWGWVLAIVVLAAFLLMIIGGKSLLRDSLIDEKLPTYYSFSKSQSAFWFLIVFSTFIYIWLITKNFDSINETALILLGISTATIATSSIINKSQTEAAFEKEVENVRVEDKSKAIKERIIAHNESKGKNGDKSESVIMHKLLSMRVKTEESNFLKDIMSDANGVAVHRLQSVLFNVVFGVIFIYEVITTYAMPNFTATQFMLMGISNVTYVAMKNSEVS